MLMTQAIPIPGNSRKLHFIARMVLREPGGSSGSQRGGVAGHTGAVAGDRGQDCPTNQV